MVLRSDIKLSTALDEFQQLLSPDQKNLFSSAISATPTPNDVLLLTDEINRKDSSRKSRICADRMRSFLNSVQQYSSALDTLAQGNQIAVLVWGSVKLVVQLALIFGDYFEKLSKWFAQLSTYCPRLHEYEELYEDSGRLQDALSEFYAIVVIFCSRCVQIYSETGVKRFVKSFSKAFKDDFRLLEENLSAAKEEVEKEIELASDQRIGRIYKHQLDELEKNSLQRSQYLSEAEENREFRSQQALALIESKELRIQKIRKEEERRKIRLRQVVFCYDYTWSFRKAVRARSANTGFWLFEKEDFRRWSEEEVPKCLWLSGITGCGKTILTGLVAEQLAKTVSSDQGTIIAYYFLDSIRKESLSAYTFLRSIIHQLIRLETLTPLLQQNLEKVFIGHNGIREPEAEELESLIFELCATKQRVILIIDGVGEAEPADRRLIIRFLKSLQQRHPFVKLFISSQLNMEAMSFFSDNEIVQIKIKPHDLDKDIRMFIEDRVGKEYTSGSLSICSPDLIDLIKETLTMKARGMFLWVDLQIKTICDASEEEHTRENISQLLNDLPEGIMELYSKILEKVLNVTDEQAETVVKLFQWVSFGRRPLTINELEEAISILPDQKSWKQPSKKLHPLAVSKFCGNLIIVDEYDGTVSPAHHTIISFLMSNEWPLNKLHLQLQKGDSYLGETCISYLNFLDFQKSLTTTSDTRNLRYLNRPTNLLPRLVSRPALLNSIGLNHWSLYRQVSRSNSVFDPECQLRLIMSKIMPPRTESCFQLFEYCRTNWHYHCHSFKKGATNFFNLKKLITKTELSFSWQPWDSPDDLDPFLHWPMFTWAVNKAHFPILDIWRYIVTRAQYASAWELLWTTVGEHIFSSACMAADKAPLNMVVHHASEDQISAGLVIAAASGRIENVERLLCHHLNAKACNMALNVAVKRGHLAVIKRLPQRTYDINAFVATYHKEHSLQVAADVGDIAAIRLILNLENGNATERTALQLAAESGDLIMVERLLQLGAKVEVPAGFFRGRTALQAAAENGHSNVIERFLQEGASVRDLPATYGGRTALQAAAGGGHSAVVERLLQLGADVNDPPPNFDGRTALQAAAGGGHLAVVERLLQLGAGVNGPPAMINGRTALQAAAEGGHHAIAELLLVRGAHVDTNNNYSGRSAYGTSGERRPYKNCRDVACFQEFGSTTTNTNMNKAENNERLHTEPDRKKKL